MSSRLHMSTPALPDERQPPLYFAGRKDELAALEAELETLCATGRAPGGLQLVRGMPGVGKTQLAMKYIGVVAESKRSGVTVCALALDPGGLSETTSLFRSICEALDAKAQGDDIAQVGDRTSGLDVQAGAASIKVGAKVSKDVGRHTGDLGMLLRQSKAEGLWAGKALVLVVDELQRIDAHGIERLAVLHMNLSNCPVQLLGFGLHHTPRVLANPPKGRGISRIKPPMELAPLPPKDALDAVAGNLEAMGHLTNSSVPPESLTALAKASFGFPQHILGYLHGADAAIRKHGHLANEALREALASGDAARATYYDQRLAAMDREPRLLYPLAVYMDTSQMKNVTREFAETLIGKDVVESAVEHGVLVEGRHDTMEFGIPSFRTHMIERAATYRDVRRREASLAKRH